MILRTNKPETEILSITHKNLTYQVDSQQKEPYDDIVKVINISHV